MNKESKNDLNKNLQMYNCSTLAEGLVQRLFFRHPPVSSN